MALNSFIDVLLKVFNRSKIYSCISHLTYTKLYIPRNAYDCVDYTGIADKTRSVPCSYAVLYKNILTFKKMSARISQYPPTVERF